MKKYIQKFSALSLVIISYAFVSGCLGGGNTGGLVRIFDISFDVSNFNTEVVAGTDTLIIREVAMHVPIIDIISPEGDTLRSIQPFIFDYDQTDDNRVAQQVTGEINFEVDDFDRFQFQIEPISLLSPLIAPLLNDGTNFYSFAITGNLNGQDFLYRSDLTRFFEGSYPTVTLREGQETLRILIQANARAWFLNSNGDGFLNPFFVDQRPGIEANFQNDIFITASGGTTSAF